jgi:hypothetical protein
MEDTWENHNRFNAIFWAIGSMHHDQMPIGIGFKLRHDPTQCMRCKANIAALELQAIIRHYENDEELEGMTVDD